MVDTARPTRERPADGAQKYTSDFREKTPVHFQYSMESTQRKGERIARLTLPDAADPARLYNLTLDHAKDVELFRDLVIPNTPLELQWNGSIETPRLFVWYRGERVDLHTDVVGGDAAADRPAVGMEALRLVYERAFREAVVSKALLDAHGEHGFDVNVAAATLSAQYVALRLTGRGTAVPGASPRNRIAAKAD